MSFQKVNAFVLEFINEMNPDFVHAWEERQNDFKTLFSKKVTKKVTEKKSEKPKSAYILFCRDNRAEVKERNPDKSTQEVTGILADMWNDVKQENGEEYQKYVALSDENKKNSNYVPEPSEKLNIKSAFQMFVEDAKPALKTENPDMKAIEINKELAGRWKDIKKTDEGKYYTDLHKEEKEKKKTEMRIVGVLKTMDEENIRYKNVKKMLEEKTIVVEKSVLKEIISRYKLSQNNLKKFSEVNEIVCGEYLADIDIDEKWQKVRNKVVELCENTKDLNKYLMRFFKTAGLDSDKLKEWKSEYASRVIKIGKVEEEAVAEE